jgi:hypothetical protein
MATEVWHPTSPPPLLSGSLAVAPSLSGSRLCGTHPPPPTPPGPSDATIALLLLFLLHFPSPPLPSRPLPGGLDLHARVPSSKPYLPAHRGSGIVGFDSPGSCAARSLLRHRRLRFARCSAFSTTVRSAPPSSCLRRPSAVTRHHRSPGAAKP